MRLIHGGFKGELQESLVEVRTGGGVRGGVGDNVELHIPSSAALLAAVSSVWRMGSSRTCV